jgi:hypothetical protein
MKIKKGVEMSDKLVMRTLLTIADELWSSYGQELVITSGKESARHSSRSLHWYGYAYDLRTKYFDQDTIPDIAQQLQLRLELIDPGKWQVITETTHIHVEYDYALRII